MKKETKPKVTIYSKNNCEPCTNAKKFFTEQNIDFIEKNIQGKKNRENLLEFRDVKKYDNIPMIEIKKNGHTAVISGFQKQDVMKELGLKPEVDVEQINKDIELFDVVHPVTDDMETSFEGISRMVMLDRYSFKDTKKETLKEGDLVVLTVKDDPSYPVRGIGFVDRILDATEEVIVWVEDEYRAQLEGPEKETGLVKRTIASIDKPLEIYYEQIAKRNATGLSEVEEDGVRDVWLEKFQEELSTLNLVPAGRVLYGAGSGEEVTYFNCYVMPYPKDSREGLAEHRRETMEIMSRGGGVGTNGSTLRPRDTLARGVNGKSSGSVSWLDDLAQLTHLVQQGGSRRGSRCIIQQMPNSL